MLGEGLATRTTREALEAVRSMQNEHEPLANSANAVLEKPSPTIVPWMRTCKRTTLTSSAS